MDESDFLFCFVFYKGHLNIFAQMEVTEDIQPKKKKKLQLTTTFVFITTI